METSKNHGLGRPKLIHKAFRVFFGKSERPVESQFLEVAFREGNPIIFRNFAPC